MISQNQEEFLELLNQPPQMGPGQMAPPPGTVSIQVTQEERDAIDRVRKGEREGFFYISRIVDHCLGQYTCTVACNYSFLLSSSIPLSLPSPLCLSSVKGSRFF